MILTFLMDLAFLLESGVNCEGKEKGEKGKGKGGKGKEKGKDKGKEKGKEKGKDIRPLWMTCTSPTCKLSQVGGKNTVISVYAASTIFRWLIAIDGYFPGCVIVGTIMIHVGLPINRLCHKKWLFLHVVIELRD